jgi:DNA repair protein SbcC/Rad50
MFLWDFFKKDKLAGKPGLPPAPIAVPRPEKKPAAPAPEDGAKRAELTALLAQPESGNRDEQLLSFMQTANATLRFEAAQGVCGKESLQELVKRFADKDRRVFKHAKDRLNHLQAEEKKRASLGALQAQYGQIAAAQSVEVSEFVQADHAYESLAKQYALQEQERAPIEMLRQQIQALLAAQTEAQRDWLALKEELAALQARAPSMAFEAIQPALAHSATKAQSLAQSPAAAKISREVQVLMQKIEQDAQSRAAQAEKLSAREALIVKAQRLSPEKIGPHDIEALQDAWRHLPALETAAVGQAERFSQALAKAKDAMHAVQEAQKERAAKARDLFAELKPKLAQALADGHAQEAIKLHDKLIARREDFRFATGGLARELHALLDEAGKLKGWQRFTNINKRDELIERAEKIAHTPLPPQLQEKEIEALQTQWRALDKELGGATDKQWDKFRAATGKAFEPVRAHKKAMAKAREQNASAKASQIAEMKELLAQVDWVTVDWRAVEQLRREAWARWRAAGPVNRKVADQLAEQNVAVMKELDERLNEAREREKRRRAALVEQAQALAGKPFPAVLVEVRALQERWSGERSGVVLPRKVEEQTWQAFRGAIDGVFAKRDEKRKELESELQTSLKTKQELLERAQALANEKDARLLESKLRDLQSQWDATGRVPHAKADGLNDAWRAAQSAAKSAAARLRSTVERDAIEAARIANLPTRASATPQQQQAKLNALLDLEIAAQSDSPDQFRDERLKRQVALLAKSFSGQRTDVGNLAKRVIDWHQLPGGDAEMDARLQVILNKIAG